MRDMLLIWIFSFINDDSVMSGLSFGIFVELTK